MNTHIIALLLRANQLLFSNPTSSNTTSLNSRRVGDAGLDLRALDQRLQVHEDPAP